MDLGLKGKKVVVTGATRGIGRAIAETFASEGADVAICARKPDEVAETVKALQARGIKAYGGVVDIADAEAFKTWIAEAAGKLGGLDMLVSNASALSNGNTDEAWRAAFDIDVLGAVHAAEAAMPFLEKSGAANGDASITIISSISAAETRNPSSYGAMKAAQIHLAKGLAYENAPKHVRINVVSPGTVYFKGGVWGNVEEQNPKFFAGMIKANPLGRMAVPQDIANSVVFLASPASSFTTGANLVVDGAITVRVNF
jgi:3-oxoacyl-[acyl-carrier protein] reductase